MNQIRTYTKSNQLNMKLQGDFQRLVCFRDGRVLKPPQLRWDFQIVMRVGSIGQTMLNDTKN